jgi:tRNA-specific 2-thiouridylase
MYSKGLTPNPCVECNRSVKFDHFIDQAKKLNCEKVATGHYAKIIDNNGTKELHKADYEEKDQSYVLHMLTSDKLELIEFPLGTISKPEVRQIAASLDLKTAFKKDSQDICFVGKNDYRNFVSSRMNFSSNGSIVDKNENELGSHNGIHEFTVGQRKGIPGGQGEPKYVTKIDVENNKVYIGTKQDLTTKKFIIEDVSFVDQVVTENISIQTRYNSSVIPCKIYKVDKNVYEVELTKPTLGVAPGQFGVIYQNTKLVGGGRISTKILEDVNE